MKIADILNDLGNKSWSAHQWVLYRAMSDRQPVAEAGKRSLNRAMSHVESSEVPVVLITAFRQTFPELRHTPDDREKLKMGLAENQRLAEVLKKLHERFFPVIGRYIYKDNKTGEDRVAEEESFLVLAGGRHISKMSKGDYLALKEWLGQLMKAFKQEAVLVKYPGNPNGYLILNDGSEMNLGPWTLKNIQENWTRMRYGVNPEKRNVAFQKTQESSDSEGVFEYFAAGTCDRGEQHAAQCFLYERLGDERLRSGDRELANQDFYSADFRNRGMYGPRSHLSAGRQPVRLKEIADLHAFDIERSLLYLTLSRGITMAEAAKRSLEPVLAIQDSVCPRFLCTAFCPGVEAAAGREACYSMFFRLRGLGYSCYPLLGKFVGKPGTEEALLVYAPDFVNVKDCSSPGWPGLKMFLMELMAAFQQKAIMLTFPGEPDAYLLRSDGTLEKRGHWSVGDLGKYYVAIRPGLEAADGTEFSQFKLLASDPCNSNSFRMAVDVYLRNALKDGTLDPEMDVDSLFPDKLEQ